MRPQKRSVHPASAFLHLDMDTKTANIAQSPGTLVWQ
jgi:hypothetical protein